MVTLHQGWSTLQLGSTPEKGLCPMAFWQHQRICRFNGERHSWNSGLHSHKESLALRRPNIGLWKMRAAISQPHIQFLAVSLRRTPGLAWVWFPHRGCQWVSTERCYEELYCELSPVPSTPGIQDKLPEMMVENMQKELGFPEGFFGWYRRSPQRWEWQ